MPSELDVSQAQKKVDKSYSFQQPGYKLQRDLLLLDDIEVVKLYDFSQFYDSKKKLLKRTHAYNHVSNNGLFKVVFAEQIEKHEINL